MWGDSAETNQIKYVPDAGHRSQNTSTFIYNSSGYPTMDLVILNKAANAQNNASTFRVYDPNCAIGYPTRVSQALLTY